MAPRFFTLHATHSRSDSGDWRLRMLFDDGLYLGQLRAFYGPDELAALRRTGGQKQK
jgi:hypothetical protein